jgi:hypothetical protein
MIGSQAGEKTQTDKAKPLTAVEEALVKCAKRLKDGEAKHEAGIYDVAKALADAFDLLGGKQGEFNGNAKFNLWCAENDVRYSRSYISQLCKIGHQERFYSEDFERSNIPLNVSCILEMCNNRIELDDQYTDIYERLNPGMSAKEVAATVLAVIPLTEEEEAKKQERVAKRIKRQQEHEAALVAEHFRRAGSPLNPKDVLYGDEPETDTHFEAGRSDVIDDHAPVVSASKTIVDMHKFEQEIEDEPTEEQIAEAQATSPEDFEGDVEFDEVVRHSHRAELLVAYAKKLTMILRANPELNDVKLLWVPRVKAAA